MPAKVKVKPLIAQLSAQDQDALLYREVAAEFVKTLPPGTDLDELREFLELARGGKQALIDLMRYRHQPVGVREFIEGSEFLNVNGRAALWPGVMDTIEEIVAGGSAGPYQECVLTGGIGVAKTTIAVYLQVFHLYLLSCLRDVHEELDQDPSAEVLIVIQSIKEATAKKVDFARMQRMIARAPYFANYFPFDPTIKSEMRFPQNIFVRPVPGLETGAIGENVIGGIIDEINFMLVVEKSARAIDQGTYDQATQNYNSIAKRRQSRFLQKGYMPGLLCLVSSRKYPGQFTDVKEEEARTNKSIYVYDKRIWELRPERYDLTPDRMFTLFKGDATRKPFIVETPQQQNSLLGDDRALVMKVPDVFKEQFRRDMIGSLRDIAGASAVAMHPFIMDPTCVQDCFARAQSVVSRDDVDFVATNLQLFPKRFTDRKETRWAHIDLAQTGDSAGLAIGYCRGFRHIKRGAIDEVLPEITFDLLLEIKPPVGGEIIFDSIRRVLYAVRKHVPLKWVSADTYQSTDMLQLLAGQGFMTGTRSMDTDMNAYSALKTALYDRRVFAPAHDKAQRELVALELDTKKNKVDHPPRGSKDVADAMAGVVFGLTMRREVWLRYGITMTRIPDTVKELSARQERDELLKGKGYMERMRAVRHLETIE